jgi:hypothetical protein
MINWFIIILIIAGIFVLVKISHLKHHKHKFSLMIAVVLILFFIGTMYFVAVTNHVDMTTTGGFFNGIKLYGGWLVNTFDNIKSLTGAVIGLDWKAENKTVGGNLTDATNDNTSLIESGKKAGGEVVNVTVNTVNSVIKPKPNTPKPITNYK